MDNVFKTIIFLMLLTVFFAAFAQKTADVVYKNGKIYTVNEKQPRAEAVAINGDRFVFVGSDEAAEKWVGANTKIVDLEGRFVMPGMYDMHLHPDLALAPKIDGELLLTPHADPETVKREILAYAEANPDKEWIVGEPWLQPRFDEAGVKPGRDWLDSFIPNRPVALLDDSRHILMINSKGLELTGMDENTYEPDHGIIHKDETGRLTGLLQDGAQTIAQAKMPKYSWRVMAEAYRQGSQLLNSYGIVGARSMHVNTERLQGLQALDRSGELTVRFDAAISWKDDIRFSVPDRAALLSGERFRYRSKHVNPNYIKFHLDGSFGTAYFFEPYLGELGAGGWRGNLNETPEELFDLVVDLDRRRITIVIHAIGDAAIRLALDAYEHMRKTNGMNELRHQIAHMNFATPEDLKRFKTLNIIPEFGGWEMWNPTGPIAELVPNYVGDRMKNYFNIAGAVENGAMAVISSDWPVSVQLNALAGIRDQVDRGGKWGWKNVSLEDMIKVATYNGAYAMGIEEQAGSIEAGKFADFIVLDGNLFDIATEEIGDVKVLKTVFEGKEVYNRN